MLNNLEFSSRSGERKLYAFVALILALLLIMSVITFVVICLPAASAASSGVVNPPADTNPPVGPDDPAHPTVDNWANSDNVSGCLRGTSSSAEDLLDINSAAAILVDMESSSAIAVKSADKKVQIASMTKVMTLITALELIETNAQMYEKVAITQEYVDKLVDERETGGRGYQKAFKAGNEVYVIDLLYSLILRSGCDSALALADFLFCR